MKRRERRMANRFAPLLLGTLMAMLLGLQGCNSAASPSEAAPVGTTTAPQTTPNSTPAAGEEGESYVASGPIVVENQLDVLAQREGVVVRILADVGAPVRKGNLLAVLDDRQLTAEREAAEAKALSCEADLKDWEAETKVAEADCRRAERMREAGINTQEELDHARYKLVGSQYEIEKAQRELDHARAVLAALELELHKTHIEAPFDGVVARRYVRAGQKVASGERLFWVSAVAPLLVKFTLPERWMASVKKGDKVYVSSVLAPETQHSAKVVQISPVVDPASGSIDVMAELEGKPGELRPGMTASVRLRAPTAKPR